MSKTIKSILDQNNHNLDPQIMKDLDSKFQTAELDAQEIIEGKNKTGENEKSQSKGMQYKTSFEELFGKTL